MPKVDGHTAGSIRRAFRYRAEGEDRWTWLEADFLSQESQIEIRTGAGFTNADRGAAELALLARQVLDTEAKPGAILSVLSRDPALSPWTSAYPGVRVPGAWDFFEMGVRAILGQQITVKAAHTLAGRVAARFGTSIKTHWAEVSLLWPQPAALASCRIEDLCALGLTRKRAETIIGFAAYMQEAHSVDHGIAEWESLFGIGPWTANYLAMRAGGMQDAFPAGDLGIQKALGIDTGKPALARRLADERSQSWRPWRSYAVMLLWKSLSAGKPAT